jgi:hypothetical protein
MPSRTLRGFIATTLVASLCCTAAQAGEVAFETRQLSDQFFAEGANVADINGDGAVDIVAGPYWYAGPSFDQRHAYRPVKSFKVQGYSDNFLTFTGDFNADGHSDILVVGWPGKAARWYENPGPSSDEGHWQKHLALKGVDNESPGLIDLVDLTGDDQPELICQQDGYFGYATYDPSQPDERWTFHRISPQVAGGRYTHGLGVGDLNGDGRPDLIEKKGWWVQPKSLEGDPTWPHRPCKFAHQGAQMLAYDVNGDGDLDVVTAWAAHGWGLAWHEQVAGDFEAPSFHRHWIMPAKPPEKNPRDVVFSQPHALDQADFDGDGLTDFVTGKRWKAHSGKDPGSDMAAVVYWYELRRDKGQVRFVPHLIDDDSGVGTQVVAADLNADGRPDVLVSNKKGTFIHLQQPR